MQDNLSNRIHAAKFESGAEYLTEQEQDSFVQIIGKGCRAATKERLARRMRLPLVWWTDYGIYRRVLFDAQGVDYCCGQSWPDEMRTLRECLLQH
jgi:hypothetical protein